MNFLFELPAHLAAWGAMEKLISLGPQPHKQRFLNQRQYRKKCRQNPSLYKSKKHKVKKLKSILMEAPQLPGEWFWRVLFFFACIGLVAAIIAIGKGIFWLIHHVKIEP